MAMLAEPRRKQKWSVDPRNSTWSKDESKFGQKMLEKMGWSKGKGLGAQEQGSTEHIRVQVKNNTLGLGASVNHEDNWIAHQDDFNQILAELNNFHGGADSDPPPNEEKKSFSLEEKSKSSKKRVHYMKFAKGKDLSCRSDTDLACIFGKREKTKKTSSPQEEHEVDSKESEENKSESPSEECESGNTVTSTLSVSEYFAKRMAELKRSRGLKTDPDRPKSTDAPDNAAKDAVKKPKKKKRDKRGGGGLLPEEQEVPETQETSNSNAECEKPRKKSKKKRKNKEFRPEDAEPVGEEEARASGAAANQGETPQKKKNKRKKSNERSEDDTPETSAYSAEPKKKKNKKAV